MDRSVAVPPRRDHRRERRLTSAEAELDVHATFMALDIYGPCSVELARERRRYLERALETIGEIVDDWRDGLLDGHRIDDVITWIEQLASAGASELFFGPIDPLNNAA